MSGISGSLGLSSSKTKFDQTTSIDALLRGLQEGNYEDARGSLPQSYTQTSPGQIRQYMNPYIDDVVENTLAAADRGQRMAVNQVADQAGAAHAFGGSRHGVAEGVAIGEYRQGINNLIGNLYATGFEGARQAAQEENQMRYAYPLQRQGMLNATLAGITPTTTTNGSSKTSGWNANISGTYGG